MREIATTLAITVLFGILWYSTEISSGLPKSSSGSTELRQDDFMVYPEPLVVNDTEFLTFINKEGKSYGTQQEYQLRRTQFKQNQEYLQAYDDLVKNGTLNNTSRVAINKFADWSPEEILKILGYKDPNPARSKDVFKNNVDVINFPEAVNWTAKGAVTPVVYQGKCASSWAFAASGYAEAIDFIQNGALESYSQQNLIDCAYKGEWDNLGCQGGLTYNAFRYMRANPLMKAKDYPYTGKDPETGSTCQYDSSTPKPFEILGINGWAMITLEQLKTLLVTSPIPVSIQANSPLFYLYSGGVITDDECGTDINHSALAVGYGKEKDLDYFIVKNSWGEDWGERGYVRIGTNSFTNLGICGILTRPVYLQLLPKGV